MTDLARHTRMDRRGFVKALGGGVLVLVSAPALTTGLAAQGRRGYPTDINAYLHIAEDGKVTLFSGKIEMGQGVTTSLAQMAAEELGAPLESFTVVAGDTASCPWDAGTWGSMTTRFFGPAVRAAAAQARLVLTDLAAGRLGVPREALTAENGVVYVTADRDRHVSYGELAKGQEITHTVGEKAVLRAVRAFRVMGRSPKRLDGREKVTGAAKFAGDVRRPGMLYARIVRPPAHGATPRSLDTAAAAAMPGVSVVNHDGLVAVLAPDPETAARAHDAVKAEWDVPATTVNTESIFEHLLSASPRAETADEGGDLAAGRTAAAKTFDQTYYNAYVAHAPMEPHVAVAEWQDGKVTVWAATQSPFGHQGEVARAFDLRPENVRIVTPFVGGGFGGKGSGAQVVEAARLAQAAGKPVMVAWTRAEEFFYDTYRPAAVVKVRSGIDAAGRMTLWDYDVYAAGSRGSDVFYDVPNRRVRAFGEQSDTRGTASYHPFATGPWRAPGANTNRFAAESQIDLMAAAAGTDPLEFRLRNTQDPRMLGVLRAVARAAGWQARPFPARSGRGRGIACGIDVGTYAAHVAEVTVDRATGAVKVERVVCAQDMGIVVNPDGARMQTEGAITMGLGYALSEGLRFEGGKILDANFDSYTLPRFSWLPRIEVVLVPNDALDPQGGGEPGIINMGGAIANAIFDATGARVYHLPMTPERVLEAIRKV
ncbi:MAG TPA: molybdopterin cofactor-binding domain-containing protein [Gemmatimonadales bacterium]|nr:molybdopterin cofactor-binding domain-containing protein [Gemmatimonadales bacterium]